MSDVIDVMGHLYPAAESRVGAKTPPPRRLVEPLRVADPASQPNAEAKPLLDRAVRKDPGLSTSDVDQGFQAGGARAAQKRENERRLDPSGGQRGPFGRTQSFLGRRAPGPRSAGEKDGATDADPGGDSNAQSVTVPSALCVPDHGRAGSRFTHRQPHDIRIEQRAKRVRCLDERRRRSEGGHSQAGYRSRGTDGRHGYEALFTLEEPPQDPWPDLMSCRSARDDTCVVVVLGEAGGFPALHELLVTAPEGLVDSAAATDGSDVPIGGAREPERGNGDALRRLQIIKAVVTQPATTPVPPEPQVYDTAGPVLPPGAPPAGAGRGARGVAAH